MKKVHNKLVRDKIPEIIKKNGDVPTYSVLNQTRFKEELKKKLIEESKELAKAPKSELKEEMADVYEVLINIAKVFKIRLSEVEKIRLDKNKKRGSFKKKYFLNKTN